MKKERNEEKGDNEMPSMKKQTSASNNWEEILKLWYIVYGTRGKHQHHNPTTPYLEHKNGRWELLRYRTETIKQ